MAKLARRQYGVISRTQLFELGWSSRQIARRAHDGRLHRIYHNVYAVGHTALTDHAYLVGALLSAGPTAFLSHRSAAAVWGLRAVNLRRIELTVYGESTRTRGPLVLHRTRHDPHPDDIRIRNGLRVSSVPKLLIELAPRETAAELRRLITLGVSRRVLPLDRLDGLAALEAALARHPGHRGSRRLAGVLRAYRRTESHASQLELAFDRFLADHPEIPDPVRNCRLDGWEIDRLWPDHNLAVELDGRPYHLAVKEMERDRLKDAALQRIGVRPVRFTDARVQHDLPGILGDLYAFLGIT